MTTPETGQSTPADRPTVVQLSKDDPDFQERKQALKEADYCFDGKSKVWRLPETNAV